MIAGPAGRQQVIAHALPVDEAAIKAQRTDMENFFAADAVEPKKPLHEARRHTHALIGKRRDHAGGPAHGGSD